MLQFARLDAVTQGTSVQFASFAFLGFLALTALVYFALPWQRARTAWLLAASLAFYYSMSTGWTLALLAVITTGYSFGWLIAAAKPESRHRTALTATGVLIVVATLAFFKYSKITGPLLERGLKLVWTGADFSAATLILPVGISFWTFMTISYLVDVARGANPERDPLRYALFISFFPHVTAGPIARASQLLPQLEKKAVFSYDAMRSGLWLMGWGFAKKLLVADPLGQFVDFVYADPQRFGGGGTNAVLTLATIGFAIQIYCDFSGYTDIVRGSARIFGIELLENFNRPYFARSVKEFWQRWHMSLMGWLKDYVYIPLGGSRVPKWRRYANIAAVFAVSGVWHGAGWTFFLWGLLNAFYQIAGELTQPARSYLRGLLRIDAGAVWYRVAQSLATFVLISVAWVFFRAESLRDALFILPRMFVPTFGALSAKVLDGLRMPSEQALLACAMIGLVFVVDLLTVRYSLSDFIRRQSLVVRWSIYLLAILIITVCGHYGPAYNSSGFAYFRF